MSKNVDFDFWEDHPNFMGPRISPQLRVRRLVDEQNRIDEAARREEIARWVVAWQDACAASGSNPQPRAMAVVRRARSDLYVDRMIHKYGAERCISLGIRREDQKWS